MRRIHVMTVVGGLTLAAALRPAVAADEGLRRLFAETPEQKRRPSGWRGGRRAGSGCSSTSGSMRFPRAANG